MSRWLSRASLQRILPGAVFAAAIIAIIILVFRGLSLDRTATAITVKPPTAMATIPLSGLLTWQQVPLAPWQLLPDGAHPTYAIAPSDGDIIYACAQPTGETMAHTWVTRDRGMSWQSLADIPSVNKGECSVGVDQLNPQIVVISTAVIKIEPIPVPVAAYLSTDGGEHWQKINAPANVGLYVTTPAATFAEIDNDPPDYAPYLAVSRDGLKTWQHVLIAHQLPTLFHYSHAGEILAMLASDPDHLWFSDDQAQTWHQQTLPSALQAININAVNGNAQGWQLCSSYDNPSILCSWDGGKTWQPLPAPVAAIPPPTTHTSTPYSFQVWGITPDGLVLIRVQQEVGKTITPAYLYRYTPATQHWQQLSTLPATSLSYTPTPGNGLIWAMTPGGAGSSQQNYVAAIP